MVHSTSTKSMDIMEIKNHKQNLLSRILHREKYIRATSRVNPLSLSTRETMLTWSLSHNHGCQSIIEISPLCSFTLLYITILHFYMLISFLIWPASSVCDIYISFCQNIKFKPCHGMFIHLQPLQLTWFRFSTKWFGLSM